MSIGTNPNTSSLPVIGYREAHRGVSSGFPPSDIVRQFAQRPVGTDYNVPGRIVGSGAADVQVGEHLLHIVSTRHGRSYVERTAGLCSVDPELMAGVHKVKGKN